MVIKMKADIDRYKDNYIAIGIRISYYRKLRGLSQEQLAERTGLSVGFLSQVEAPGYGGGGLAKHALCRSRGFGH